MGVPNLLKADQALSNGQARLVNPPKGHPPETHLPDLLTNDHNSNLQPADRSNALQQDHRNKDLLTGLRNSDLQTPTQM